MYFDLFLWQIILVASFAKTQNLSKCVRCNISVLVVDHFFPVLITINYSKFKQCIASKWSHPGNFIKIYALQAEIHCKLSGQFYNKCLVFINFSVLSFCFPFFHAFRPSVYASNTDLSHAHLLPKASSKFIDNYLSYFIWKQTSCLKQSFAYW